MIGSHAEVTSTIVGSVYTREDAFEDGVLVDASRAAIDAGFSWPMALTEACWRDCVSWDDEDNARKDINDAEEDSLWDVMLVAADAVKQAAYCRRAGPDIPFSLCRVPRAALSRSPECVDLILTVGVDGGTVVGTISLAVE